MNVVEVRPRFGVDRFLTVYLALLFVLPARLSVPGLGAAGAPASLWCLVGAAWYLAERLRSARVPSPMNPVRLMVLVYLCFLTLSWVVAKARPNTALEATSSDRALIANIGLAALALLVIRGIEDIESLRRVVRRIVGFSMVMVAVGLVQFRTGVDLTRYMNIPGLVSNIPGIEAVQQRSIFNRPFGTALHPIEYGVVAAALLPMSLWVAQHTSIKRRWLMTGAIALAAMTSISRSAVLALAIGGIVLLLGATWRQRVNMTVAAMAFVVAAGTVIPGLVGTLRSLFRNTDVDPSIQARIRRVPRVLELLAERPWFGRGLGTFTPEDYFLLDNEVQKIAIEGGAMGIVNFALFFGGVMFLLVRFARTTTDPTLRALAVSLVAAIAAIAFSSYTFDAFFYHILTGLLFLFVGLAGALISIDPASCAPVDPHVVAVAGTVSAEARTVARNMMSEPAMSTVAAAPSALERPT